MYRKVADKIQGVINDFDLAVYLKELSDHDTTLTHRTGTLPFLALDLLKPYNRVDAELHGLKYDIESCLWVFVYDALCTPEGLDTTPGTYNAGQQFLLPWVSSDIDKHIAHKKDLVAQLDSWEFTDIDLLTNKSCWYTLTSHLEAVVTVRQDNERIARDARWKETTTLVKPMRPLETACELKKTVLGMIPALKKLRKSLASQKM